VQILNLNMRLLPIYLQPTKTEKLDSSWLYDRTSQVIYSRRTEARGKTYGLDYLHLDYSPDALRTARGLDASDPIQRAYTQVTRSPRSTVFSAGSSRTSRRRTTRSAPSTRTSPPTTASSTA